MGACSGLYAAKKAVETTYTQNNHNGNSINQSNNNQQQQQPFKLLNGHQFMIKFHLFTMFIPIPSSFKTSSTSTTTASPSAINRQTASQ